MRAALLFLSAFLAGSALSCSGSRAANSEAPSAAAAATQPIERYLPLKNRHVYAYESLNEETGMRGVFTLEVSRRKERADLLVGGRVTQRLEVLEDGIAYVEGGYLLKQPLDRGAKWKGRFGTVTVHDVDHIADVPAGRFVGCVRTIEEASLPAGSKKVTSTYCPDVGLVSLQAEGVSDEGLMRETVLLKSFGPRLELTLAHPQ